jgi:hypothetical protein
MILALTFHTIFEHPASVSPPLLTRIRLLCYGTRGTLMAA